MNWVCPYRAIGIIKYRVGVDQNRVMPQDRPRLESQREIENPDRSRGILSPHDRQFLLEESYRDDLAAQSQRNVRARIRERLRNAILDFYLLDEYLEDQDREQVFSEHNQAVREGIHANLAFLFRVANRDTETFASWMASGLTHIELDSGPRLFIEAPGVDLDITPGESVDPDEALAKMEAGEFEALTSAELRFLLWRVGKQFSGIADVTPELAALCEYVERFEEQTQIAEAREWLEDELSSE